jgi:hypothetical protein
VELYESPEHDRKRYTPYEALAPIRAAPVAMPGVRHIISKRRSWDSFMLFSDCSNPIGSIQDSSAPSIRTVRLGLAGASTSGANPTVALKTAMPVISGLDLQKKRIFRNHIMQWRKMDVLKTLNWHSFPWPSFKQLSEPASGEIRIRCS